MAWGVDGGAGGAPENAITGALVRARRVAGCKDSAVVRQLAAGDQVDWDHDP